jgi:hypothetical protein
VSYGSDSHSCWVIFCRSAPVSTTHRERGTISDVKLSTHSRLNCLRECSSLQNLIEDRAPPVHCSMVGQRCRHCN